MTNRKLERQAEFLRQATEATSNLRTGTSALMRALRRALAEKCVDSSKVVLVGIQVDNIYSHAGGELVLPGGDAIAFAFEWADATVDAPKLTQWRLDNNSPARAVGLKLLSLERVEDQS